MVLAHGPPNVAVILGSPSMTSSGADAHMIEVVNLE